MVAEIHKKIYYMGKVNFLMHLSIMANLDTVGNCCCE